MRLLFALSVFALIVLAFAGQAEARGNVIVRTTVIDEKDGEWKIKLKVDYGSTPHIPHIPMVFTFKPVAIYERQLTDDSPDKPVERRVGLQGQTDINLPMDVGFADARGETFKVTEFSVSLTREADFEAGEYEMTVKLSEGGTLGGRTLLRLKGNNKPVDRRSMVFTASAPKKKKENPAAKEAAKENATPKPVEEYGPDLSDIPDVSQAEANRVEDPHAPPEVDQKQGGCGCTLPEKVSPTGWLAALGLIAVWMRRRRQ